MAFGGLTEKLSGILKKLKSKGKLSEDSEAKAKRIAAKTIGKE